MNHKKSFLGIMLLLLLAMTVGIASADTPYVVQPGDTLSAISRRFGVSVQAIAAANNIVNPNLIFAGQTLVIPTASGPPSEAQPPAPAPAPPSSGTTYLVQPGDTLTRIAVRFGVTVQAIAQANGLTNINLIYSGQTLVIPGTSSPEPAPVQPTPTPAPAPSPAPTATPVPAPSIPVGVNLLPNGSFEEGWYHINGIPELQVPNHWTFEWDAGSNPLDPDPWNQFVRPETRVLSSAFLPPNEHGLFIWDGSHTVKVFKGQGAISFRLVTDVYLEPGTYMLEINVFPDLVVGYTGGGGKIWAPDPLSGEVSFVVGGPTGNWILPAFGQKNTLQHTFQVTSAGTVRVGAAIRGRWAILNNGWFMDNWSLQRLSG